MSGAGDVNKDGYDDVIVGSSSEATANGSTTGASYIIYGGEFANNALPNMATSAQALEAQDVLEFSDAADALPAMGEAGSRVAMDSDGVVAGTTASRAEFRHVCVAGEATPLVDTDTATAM